MQYSKPKSRPRATLDEVLTDLTAVSKDGKTFKDHAAAEKLYLVGVRGYYADSFGKPDVNDRIYFDDALFLVERGGAFESFNFNTDPSITFRKFVATLKADEIYECVKHRHKGQYDALQIVRDIVSRDGVSGWDIGRHGINFHYDAEAYSKFSLGCQTVPRSQWLDLQTEVYRLMDKHKLSRIKYFLIEK